MKVDKSQEMRQKEARVEELEGQVKRTRTTLKSLKTRLSNTQERVEEVQREMFNKASRLQERLARGYKVVEELAAKLRKDKRLRKQDKALIEEIYHGFAGGVGEEMPNMEAQAAEWAEQQGDEARFRDAFREFRVEPPKEEQRDIRKLYLRLSKQFHPDRARNKKEAEQFHQYQQQVNEAYERHDIQVLIELEQLWGELEEGPAEGKAPTTDVLDARIARLEHQLGLLKQQQERLSEEIRQLRKSNMGQMLTDVDSMERAGFSIEEGMGLQQLEPIVELLDAFEKALRDTEESGEMSPLFDDIMRQMMAAANPLEELLSQMMGEDEDVGAPFWDWDEEEDYTPNLFPKFPVGSYVRIEEEQEFFGDDDGMEVVVLKGLTGIVSEALIDEEGESVYHVILDSASMKRLPVSAIQGEGTEFNVLYYLYEDTLAAEKKKKESPKKIHQTYRTLLYQNIFEGLPPEQDQRLQSILLARPAGSDEENWLAFLEENLDFPFGAFTYGEFSDWRRGRKATVLAYGGFSPEYGLVVQARIGRLTDFAPLAEFYGAPGSEVGRILADYGEWFEVMF